MAACQPLISLTAAAQNWRGAVSYREEEGEGMAQQAPRTTTAAGRALQLLPTNPEPQDTPKGITKSWWSAGEGTETSPPCCVLPDAQPKPPAVILTLEIMCLPVIPTATINCCGCAGAPLPRAAPFARHSSCRVPRTGRASTPLPGHHGHPAAVPASCSHQAGSCSAPAHACSRFSHGE